MKFRLAKMLAIISLSIVALFAATPPAHAVYNFGEVMNVSGSSVRVDCHGGKSYVIPEGWPDTKYSDSAQVCSDVDQFKSYRDGRCVKYTGPGYPDGWYYLKPDVFRRVDGYADAKVYAYTSSRCSKDKPFNN